MDNWTFGLTMTVVGVGGTFLTLGLLILSTYLFKKFLPVPTEGGPEQGKGKG
ncbi:MAG: OadG family protein [Pseudomonadota bacterium]